MNTKNIGSSVESFFEEVGLLEEVTGRATTEIAEAMKGPKIVKLEPCVLVAPAKPGADTNTAGNRYFLLVTLSDGRTGEVDVTDILKGEAFGSLRDPARFCEVKLDQEWHAPVWPNGADICPDVIEERLRR